MNKNNLEILIAAACYELRSNSGKPWSVSPDHYPIFYKFAEYIIDECCHVIDNHHEPVYNGDILKKHFGVIKK